MVVKKQKSSSMEYFMTSIKPTISILDYANIYTKDFFLNADGISEWNDCKLKYGDALASMAYAFGVKSFEDFRSLAPFDSIGKHGTGDGIDAKQQLTAIIKGQSRTPKGILEIGPGRGEVAVSFSYLKYKVQIIDPSPGVFEWLNETSNKLFNFNHNVKIYNEPLHKAVNKINWNDVDTVIMVESLEHILEDDFNTAYDIIKYNLKKANGRLIIVNWIDFHPIQIGQGASCNVHCRTVDDALYNKFTNDAVKCFYRNGSHIVLDY